jgi:hypothetical protein
VTDKGVLACSRFGLNVSPYSVCLGSHSGVYSSVLCCVDRLTDGASIFLQGFILDGASAFQWGAMSPDRGGARWTGAIAADRAGLV